MKRAFAIVIVVLLGLGMIGLFFIPLLAGGVSTPTATYTTTPTQPAPAVNVAPVK
jgi:hypothetical protein